MSRLVVVSNRVPDPSAGAQAGGLAVALHSLMERRGGLWFGWSGKIVDDPAQNAHTVTEGRVEYATVDLTQEEHDRYYTGFSNSTLWPLLHSMPELMTFDRRDAQIYREVNERLADILAPMLRPGDTIWVHDYHLLALPALLRARGIDAPIGFFLHIPFPSPDVLATAPEMDTLVRDLLQCDLVGFQTPNDTENFTLAARRMADATVESDDWLSAGGRRVRVGAFPVEIEAPEFARTAEAAWHSEPVERLRRSLGERALVIGADRLDPTKGLLQRMAGYRRFLETHEEWLSRVTFLQIAAESRGEVSAYQDLRAALEQDAGHLNGEWSEPDWTPVRFVARAVSRETVAGYMREARVGLVTPLRDGMNLVAKEYVAAQNPDDPGVLVLSRFAGAAKQLDASLLVNPHDADEIAEALDAALGMELAERLERWRACWGAIEGVTALGWGESFLAALPPAPGGA